MAFLGDFMFFIIILLIVQTIHLESIKSFTVLISDVMWFS